MVPDAAEQVLARLTVPADVDNLSAVLGLVRELAARQGLSTREVERLAFAAEEACANVIDHAYPAGQPGPLDLLLLRRPGQLVVAIEDQGLPADFQALEAGAGLGELLRRFFDGEVRCLARGRQGNRVELVKKLPAAPHPAELAEAEIQRAASAQAARPEEPLTLRLMKPEEALELVRCLYRSYGYSYDCDYMYDPRQIRERQQNGLMRSMVALNQDGEIVGHLALNLDRPDAPAGETAQAIVDPRYRGHHLFEKLKGLLRDDAQRRGMYGIYSEAVTLHPYSQKGNLAVGARETGLLLGYVPASVSDRQIQEQQRQRQAVALFYLVVNNAPARAVYPPPRHEEIVRRVYEQTGLARNVSPPTAPDQASGPARLDVRVRTDHNEAFLHVRAFGTDLVEQARRRVRELCLERVDCLYLDLPLSDPATAVACPRLEELGFFFGGILPELDNGDLLRLQLLNNVAVDAEQIQLASDFGQELLAYVLAAREAAPCLVPA